MKILDALTAAHDAKRAILATNFYNAETLIAVLRAAEATEQPVILQTSPSTLDYLGIPMAAAMARAAADDLGVTAWLHLDHATDVDLVRRCVDAGYDSVMIDASESPFDENVHAVRTVLEFARPAGVIVEAELGYVPKLDQAAVTEDGLTTPEQAQAFVEKTGVDLLAVAIGTAHGFYKAEPKLDLSRLQSIREIVDVPLVLHGGSGVPADQLQASIRLGIAKVNFATEIKNAFTRGIQESLAETDDIDLRKTFPAAMAAVTKRVADQIRVCATAGAKS